MTDKITYKTAVRDFDHEELTRLPAYPQLRQALNDIATEANRDDEADIPLGRFLDAVRDMAATTPYADDCDRCAIPAWPHKVDRDGDWVNGTYHCGSCGRTWTYGYAVDVMLFL